MLLVLVAALVALATLGVGVARAWHADGVTVTATCDKESESYLITATIQQSNDWPGAFVKSITPSSVDGYTKGDQTVTVVVGWTTSTETQTFRETVTLDGDCGESNDPTGTLVVIKNVVNDDGGDASAGDWTMNVSGPTSLSFAGAESPGTSNTVDAGDYTITESGGPSGYTLSYSGDCDSSGNVTVPAFHERTCVLTNDDVAPETPTGTLVVIKHVINDSGGSASADDWTMNVSGPTSLAFAGAEDPGTSNTVDAGDYKVTESGGPAGYTLSYSGDCDSSGDVTVPAFHTRTCVLTNDDVVRPPQEKGSISVSKSADPTSIKEPGGPVTFSVRVTNSSADVNVVVTNVVDDKFGDLDDDGGSGCFDVPFNLAPGAFASCQFTEPVTGPGGTTHVDTVTASGQDANGNPVSASDSAEVVITPKLIDLVVTKQATSPTKLHGTVHYALTVTNKGPDQATNVQLADPAPAGITYLTATSSQGTCMVAPALVTCSLGTLASGQTVTIAITGRSDTVGSHTNTATVTGAGGRETNPADNTASAVTVTPAPVTPPTPKPKPHPKPCLALNVTPKMIKADGKPDKVVVKVTAGSKAVAGAKVAVHGTGIEMSGRTGSNGVVVFTVNASKTGLITVSTPETRHSCGSRRIGVAGVFLPPVTG